MSPLSSPFATSAEEDQVEELGALANRHRHVIINSMIQRDAQKLEFIRGERMLRAIFIGSSAGDDTFGDRNAGPLRGRYSRGARSHFPAL